jgi:surface protein
MKRRLIPNWGGVVDTDGFTFKATLDTEAGGDNPGDDTFIIPTILGGSYNYDVVYDGSVIHSGVDETGNTITFPDGPGLKEIFVLGTFEGFGGSAGNLDYKLKIQTFECIDGFSFTTGGSGFAIFYNCPLLTSFIGNPDFTSTTVISSFFFDCPLLTTVLMDDADVSTITNFGSFFRNTPSLTTLGISNWNTSSATFMSSMLRSCGLTGTINLNHFDVSGVTGMDYMFSGSAFTVVQNTTWTPLVCDNFSNFASSCSNLTTIYVDNFVTLNTTKIDSMFKFSGSVTGLDVSGWITNNLLDIESAFFNATSVNILNCSSWVLSPTGFARNFAYGTNITAFDFTGFDFSSATSVSSFLAYSSVQTVTGFNALTFPASVIANNFLANSDIISIDMSGMTFNGAANLSSFAASCSSLTTVNIDNVNFGAANLEAMFFLTPSITSFSATNANMSQVPSLRDFVNQSGTFTLDISTWNTQNVTSFLDFAYLGNVTIVGLDTLDVSSATTMENFSDQVNDATMLANAYIYWSSLTLQSGVTLRINNTQYDPIGDAARQSLINNDLWVIYDNGYSINFEIEDINGVLSTKAELATKLGVTEPDIPNFSIDGSNRLEASVLGLTTVPLNAFDGDAIIGELILPEGVTTLDSYCFRDTSLTTFTPPSTLTTLNTGVFQNTPLVGDLNWLGQITSISVNSLYNTNYTILSSWVNQATLPQACFRVNPFSSGFSDPPSVITTIGNSTFANASLNNISVDFQFIEVLNAACFSNSIDANVAFTFSSALTTMGSAVTDPTVFNNCNSTFVVTVPTVFSTINGGGPHASLAHVTSQGGTVNYI